MFALSLASIVGAQIATLALVNLKGVGFSLVRAGCEGLAWHLLRKRGNASQPISLKEGENEVLPQQTREFNLLTCIVRPCPKGVEGQSDVFQNSSHYLYQVLYSSS